MRRHAPLGSQNGPSSTQQRTAQLAKQKEIIENPRKEQWKTKENKEIKGKPTNHNLKEGMRRGMRRIYEHVFFYPFLAMVTTQNCLRACRRVKPPKSSLCFPRATAGPGTNLKKYRKIMFCRCFSRFVVCVSLFFRGFTEFSPRSVENHWFYSVVAQTCWKTTGFTSKETVKPNRATGDGSRVWSSHTRCIYILMNPYRQAV